MDKDEIIKYDVKLLVTQEKSRCDFPGGKG